MKSEIDNKKNKIYDMINNISATPPMQPGYEYSCSHSQQLASVRV